jgi:AraC-like DNA-binding protein
MNVHRGRNESGRRPTLPERLLLRASPLATQMVRAALPAVVVEECQTDRSFVEAISEGSIAPVVCEMSRVVLPAHTVVRAVERASATSAALLLADIRSQVVVQAVVELAQSGGCCSFVLLNDQTVLEGIQRWWRERTSSSPEQEILQGVVRDAPTPVWNAVVGSAVSGRRRHTVPDLAQLVGVSPRTLEASLHSAGAPPPRTLLAWGVALHATWCLEFLGMSAKQVAASAGFGSASAFSNFIFRNVGSRPSHILASGGFRALLARLSSLLGR